MGRGSKHGIDRDQWLGDAALYCARGIRLPHAKLMPLDVAEIRSAARQREALRQHIRNNLSNEALARKFGVHVRTIEKVLSYENWRQEL